MAEELYLCVYAKEFPAQALLRMRPDLRSKAVAVMDGQPPFQRVCSQNEPAGSLGIEAGMGRAETDGFPSVNLLPRSLREEQAARVALLECAGSFTPRVEDGSDDGCFMCVLDITGTETLFGPPSSLAPRVQKVFATAGVACTIAVSANPPTAICLARGAKLSKRSIVVEKGNERQALAPLPLSVLDISAGHLETFTQWGISTLGALAALPETELIARLGQEAKRLRQLARGECPHFFQPVEPAVVLDERIEMDTPVELLESLLFGAATMLDQLIARAAARALSLASITAELGLEGGARHTRIVRPALPSTDKQLWLKLLHLDWTAHPPQAPVLSMALRAEPGTSGKAQLGLF